MKRRVHFITLGIANLARAKKFYGALFGWKPAKPSVGDVVFFDMGGYVLSLFPRRLLAKDANISAKGKGFSGIALAHNVGRKKDVAIFLQRAKKCGGKIIKPAEDAFWGGHSGYFADPDGHLWEVAYNPFMPIQKDGRLEKL